MKPAPVMYEWGNLDARPFAHSYIVFQTNGYRSVDYITFMRWRGAARKALQDKNIRRKAETGKANWTNKKICNLKNKSLCRPKGKKRSINPSPHQRTSFVRNFWNCLTGGGEPPPHWEVLIWGDQSEQLWFTLQSSIEGDFWNESEMKWGYGFKSLIQMKTKTVGSHGHNHTNANRHIHMYIHIYIPAGKFRN